MKGVVTRVADNRVTLDMARGCLNCEADLLSEAAIAKMVPNRFSLDGLFCDEQCLDAFWNGEGHITPWDIL